MSDTNFEMSDDTVVTDALGADARVFGAGSSNVATHPRASSYGRDAIYKTARAALADDAATSRTNLGLGTANSPQFTGIELGHATDTTVARSAAGRLSVEGVGIPLATDLMRSVAGMAGFDLTGATSSRTGFNSLKSLGGVWFLPAGEYMIDDPGVDWSSLVKSLWIIADPAAHLFSPSGATAIEGDMFNIAPPSDGTGLPAQKLTFGWTGGYLDGSNILNSTSLPFSGTYAPANLGTAGTGDLISIRGTYTSGTVKNAFARVEITNGVFYFGDHWESAGGDQAIFVSGIDACEVRGNRFIGCRDLAVYASTDPTTPIPGTLSVTNNTFVNCVFGVSPKRGALGFEIRGNFFDNCVIPIVLTRVSSPRVGDGVVIGNVAHNSGMIVRADYCERVLIMGNSGYNYGPTDESGDFVNIYDHDGYGLYGCKDCTVEHNRLNGKDAVASAVNVRLLRADEYDASGIVQTEDCRFAHNVGRDLYSPGGEYNTANYNDWFGNHVINAGSTANVTVVGANSSNVRYDRTNGRYTFHSVFQATAGIEVGAASDTTLTRTAAGVLAIEGVEIVTLSRAQTLTNKTLTTPLIGGLAEYADDAAASAGGVAIGGLYRTASALKIRVA